MPETETESKAAEQATTFTQAEVNEIVRKRLGDTAEQRRKAAEFDKLEEAQRTEAEKAAARIAELERDNAALEAGKARIEIAAKHGLTPAQARRLVGTTADELEADAAELAKDLGISTEDSNSGTNGRPTPGLRPVVAGGGDGKNGNDASQTHPMDAFMRSGKGIKD